VELPGGSRPRLPADGLRGGSVSGGAGVDGTRRSANKIDRRRSRMESPIEVVRVLEYAAHC